MCMARAPIKGQILVNLMAGLAGPSLKEGAAVWSDLRGLRGEASSERYILISSDLLERFNGALAITGPQTSYFGGIITCWQVSKY